jgi:endoglucanase
LSELKSFYLILPKGDDMKKIFQSSRLIFFTFCLSIAISTIQPDAVHSSVLDSNIVDIYGQLQVRGNRIVDQHGNEVALRGMSLFWSQWMGQFYNYDCLNWLRDDWKCTVIRAAMGIESGGYLTNPVTEKAKVMAVVDACIDLGIYVIIDWHDHNAHNHQAEAISFFAEMAQLYGNEPNVIYEIYNEPEQVSWSSVIKPYAEAVIDTIRKIDPDNLIIVGTPNWSQYVDVASNDTLAFNNITYALHFYAASHKQWLRNRAVTALNHGIALFVSEWGTCENTGTGFLDSTETKIWWNFMDNNMISWCNWSIADKEETASALVPGASPYGGWPLTDLTTSGKLVRKKIITWNDSIASPIGKPTSRLNIPDAYNIWNYPNPFNSTTHFQFFLPSAQLVKIDIYNLIGEKIASLVNSRLPAGSYDILYRCDHLASGIYIYHYQAGKNNQIRKMQLIK